jgi:hypothetical protein
MILLTSCSRRKNGCRFLMLGCFTQLSRLSPFYKHGRLGQLGVTLGAYGNLPRPESGFLVFTSPEEAAEAGLCALK